MLVEESKEPIWLLLINGFLSIGTTFLNKLVTSVFPDVFLILFVQNLLGVCITTILYPRYQSNWLSYSELPRYILFYTFCISWMFMGMLWTSLVSLGSGSVTLSVLAKSCLPLCIALLEPLCFNERRNPRSYLWLVLMAACAGWIARSDPTATISTLLFLALNLILTASLSIIERILVIECERRITPVQIGTLRNFWSLPIAFLFFIVSSEEPLRIVLTLRYEFSVAGILLLSAIFGNGLSLSGFILKSKTTSTTIAVFGTGAKILSILIDRIFYSTMSLSWSMWILLGVYTGLIVIYLRDEERFPRYKMTFSPTSRFRFRIIAFVIVFFVIMITSIPLYYLLSHDEPSNTV